MIDYRDARIEDGPALADMAMRSFVETFGHLYSKANLDAFIASAFGPEGLASHVGDPAYAIRLALDGDTIAGFAKVSACGLPDPAPTTAVELRQLYVLAPWQGAGIAPTLMEWAINLARQRGGSHLVLSVFNENARAKRFYARYGMAEIGAHPFRVGDQLDDDRIWSVTL